MLQRLNVIHWLFLEKLNKRRTSWTIRTVNERQKNPVSEVLEQAQVSHLMHTGPAGGRGQEEKPGDALAALVRSAPPARPPAALPLPAARGARSGHSSLPPGIRGSHVCSAGRVNNFTCTRSRIKWVFDWRVSAMRPGTKRKVIHKPFLRWVFNSHTMTRVIVICAFDLCLSPLRGTWQFNRVERARLN